jgi:hypothetical protein
MKKLLYSTIIACLALAGLTSCDPQESDDHSLGAQPQASQLAFTATPTSAKPNVIDFANTSSVPGVALWDLGNGSTAEGTTVQGKYPYAGTYTVTMTLYTSGGSATISQEITVANDDATLLDTPWFNALTGGASAVNGKTWVFDQYHSGHFGVDDVNAYPRSGGWWWSCPEEGKAGSSLYEQEFTFILDGTRLEWKNNGNIYTNENGMNALGHGGTLNPTVGDYDCPYTPASGLTFSLNEAAGTLTLSGGAFLGHYAGTSTYYIEKLTEDELWVYCKSTVEPGNAWWYHFVPKEKNVKPEVVITLKAPKYTEDFEGAEFKVPFEYEALSDKSGSWANPAPVPINESDKVLLYQKKDGEKYSNVFFIEPSANTKFDLTKGSKIRLKVYIPSYNDYTTVVNHESWAVSTLQKQVSVKLQNNDLGGNAYTTQAEIVKSGLVTDKWIELEFDFSAWADRQDFDKVVIQFGGEGHDAPGTFFLDDFYFGE